MTKNTLIVAAGAAYDFYRRHSAYVCQPGRSFQPVSHLGFYRDKRIEALVPEILDWRDHVPFTRENADRLLDSGQERDEALGAVIWNSLLEGSRVDGDRHEVLLLTPPEDARTVRLPRAIRHGGHGPWLLGHRYASLHDLLKVPTTKEIPTESERAASPAAEPVQPFTRSGNLFESFLGGRTPAMSWDVKKDMDASSPFIVNGARLRRYRPRQVEGGVKSRALRLAEHSFSAQEIEHFTAKLASKLGIRIPAKLEGFEQFSALLDALSAAEQLRLYDRLWQVAFRPEAKAGGGRDDWRAPSQRIERKRSRKRKQTRGKRTLVGGPTASMQREPPVPVASRQTPAAQAMSASHCALCRSALSDSEKRHSQEQSSFFLGQAYCAEHAAKIEALFGVE